MRELALFAGAGGGILASILAGHRTVAAVEIDPYCREVLLRRQRDGVLPVFPIWDDINTFDGRPWRGVVDLVNAGFPCQPFSVAGRRRGKDDARNLWPETIRVIREVGPDFALLENVPGLLVHAYFGVILGDLAESGFDAIWDCIPASAVGAPHQRDRLWILAYSRRLRADRIQPESIVGGGEKADSRQVGGDVPDANSKRLDEREERDSSPPRSLQGTPRNDSLRPRDEVADAKGKGSSVRQEESAEPLARPERGSWWEAEPDVGRVVDGLAFRLDRLRALGNGQVPEVARRVLSETAKGVI